MRKLAAILLLPFALVAATAAQAAITPGATPGNFTVSESGAASYSIPIAVAPGTAGMEPKLSLNYSSQGGSGIAGTGWSLSGLSAVTRCGNSLIQDGINRGVQYDAKDRFCLDGQRLIVINGGTYGAVGAEYRTEIESFTKVLSYGGVAGDPQYFKAQTKSGQILEFGNTADSRAEAQGKTQAAAWTVNKISDTVGNYLGFTYTENNATGEQRVSRIDYTGNSATGLSPYNHIDFSYAARANTAPAVYVAGSMNQLTQRLTAITTWAGTIQARTYTLAYAAQGDFLASVQECDGAGTCVNPTTFTWQFPAASAGDFEAVTQVVNFAPKTGWFASSGDVNGDGFDDHLKSKVLIKPFSLTVDDLSYLLLRLATGDANVFAPAVEVATTALRDCSIVANCNGASQKTSLVSILGDINGDGRADLILGDGGVALSNGDGTLAAPYQANVQIGSAPFASARDVNGDGRADLMFGRAEVDNLTHYYIQYVQGNGSLGTVDRLYTYDANGNQLTGPGRTLTWTGWNMPATLVESTGTTSWSYDSGHQRIKQVQPGKTTYFLNPRIDTGGHYERVVYTSGQVDNIHILYAGGQIIGQYVTSTASASKTRYFHLDHLGSVSVVTNETGVVVDRYAYDAWGKRQTITGSASETEHGFTGHEHLDDGLIHMNGRIYDPVLARFLSADPYVQDAGDSQAYNRFAYVRNNPLCYADPSGFSWWTKFRDNWIRPIVAAIASYYTFGLVSGLISYVPGAFAAGALAGGAVSSLINTGNLSNLGQSSLSTLLFAGANGIGVDGSFSRALANAGAGCISAESGGGNCGQGGGTFLAAYALGRSLDFVTQDLRLYGVSGADVPSAELSRIGGSGNAFINGIKNTVNDAINNFRDISHLGGDFILIYNPSAGFFGDLVESAQDVLGSGSKVSRQLAGILGDAQASGYSVNLWAHSQGGAILGSALGQLSGMKGLTVNMAGAAANQGVVVSAAARAGASMGAFKTNSFDFVTMVIGRNGNPLQMLGATLASPLLFGGRDMSPHSGPAYSQ